MDRRPVILMATLLVAFPATGLPIGQAEKPPSLSGEFSKTELWEPPEPGKEPIDVYAARLKANADAGDVKAQATLGWCYFRGLGVARDLKLAVDWTRRAAESGHAGAQCNLGHYYDEGIGVPRDPDVALAWFRKAADQGIASAQYNVGLSYAAGAGVPQDWAEAARWYRKAVAGGWLAASNNLGNIYLLGRGVAADLNEAVRWLKPPAEAGLAASAFGLAVALDGQDKHEEAAPWHRRSAEGGFVPGTFTWSLCLWEGRGVKKDRTEALKWIRRAAEHDLAAAQVMLARILIEGDGAAKDEAEGLRWARRAADQLDARGQNIVGVCYHRGAGVPQDIAEAVRWYQLAAARNNPEAALTLASFYEGGKGVAKDLRESLRYIRIAADAGNVVAQWRMAENYRDGVGVESDLGEAEKWFHRVLENPAIGAKAAEARRQLTEVEQMRARTPERKAEVEFQLARVSFESKTPDYAAALPHLQAAAKDGHARAMAFLGIMYQNGWSVAHDDAAAIQWYRSGAALGDLFGQAFLADRLARGIGAAADENSARLWLARATENRDTAALLHVGLAFVKGEHGASNNAAIGIVLLHETAQRGNVLGQNSTGFGYMIGAGVPRDPAEAYKWLKLSDARGNFDAHVNLENLLPTLTAEQKAEGERRAREFKPQTR